MKNSKKPINTTPNSSSEPLKTTVQDDVLDRFFQKLNESIDRMKPNDMQTLNDFKNEQKEIIDALLKSEKANTTISRVGIGLGIFSLVVSIVTFIYQYNLGDYANKLIEKQTEIADAQAKAAQNQLDLTQAQINSSQNYQLSPLFEEISKEAGANKGVLSERLINKIASVVMGLRPYHYRTAIGISERPLSPERGQLLLYLAHSNLDSSCSWQLFRKVSFENADLKNTLFPRDAILKGCTLKNADFTRAQLIRANLKYCDLQNVDLSETNLIGAKLEKCNFHDAIMNRTEFNEANFKSARGLETAKLQCALISAKDTSYFKKYRNKKADYIKIGDKSYSSQNQYIVYPEGQNY